MSIEIGRPRRAAMRGGRPSAVADAGRDVHVYFDNDQHANAPRDARGLATRLA